MKMSKLFPPGKKGRAVLFVSLALLAWIIYARKGLRMTMSDKKARKYFASHGLQLHTETRIIDGHHIHYAWTGNMALPILFFIHGSPKSWTFYSEFLRDDKLRERFRLVSVDRPGFGQSDFGHAERIPVQADLLVKLLDKISKGQEVYLVGHSFGAPVAVAMAALRPAMIKTIVLAAGAMDPSAETTASWRKIFILPAVSYFMPGALRPSNKELYYLGNDLSGIQARFTEVQCPVYLVHALDDKIVPYQQSEYAAKMFMNAPLIKLISFPTGGHFFLTKRYVQFRDLLLHALRPQVPA